MASDTDELLQDVQEVEIMFIFNKPIGWTTTIKDQDLPLDKFI